MSLRFQTGGESHGQGGLAFLEGLPKGLALDPGFIDSQLARRQRGYGRSGRQGIEKDRAQILGGVRAGRCLEAPLLLWVPNRDSTIEERDQLASPRPGHGDLAGCLRHGDQDVRANLERASARETASRVAAGAVAQLLLRSVGCEVLGHVVGIGGVHVPGDAGQGLDSVESVREARERVEASEFGIREPGPGAAMKDRIDDARRQGDSVGGQIEVVAAGLPAGLGSFAQWDARLDGRLAQALISIPAIKSFEIGLGREVGERLGSEVHDPILPAGDGAPSRIPQRSGNRAGGLEAGISNGQPLVLRCSMKPIATLRRGLPSVDLTTGEAVDAAFERSDICAVPAAALVAEAMTALVLAQATLELFGGASHSAFLEAHRAHADRMARIFG
jgi:chorismate synthase